MMTYLQDEGVLEVASDGLKGQVGAEQGVAQLEDVIDVGGSPCSAAPPMHFWGHPLEGVPALYHCQLLVKYNVEGMKPAGRRGVASRKVMT